jgi:DNA transformation protein and related proteins
MAPSEGFKDFITDQLAGFGPVTIRNMFGGAGIYAEGVMFGLLADDVLYLKADETSSRAFAAEGMGPFTYEPDGRAPVAMSYWEVPPRLLEEPGELAQWAAEAHRIARLGKTKAAKIKPSRKRAAARRA